MAKFITPTTWTQRGTSSSNTAVTASKVAVANQTNVLTGYCVAVTGAAVGAAAVTIDFKSGSTIKWRDTIAASAVLGTAVRHNFSDGVEWPENTAIDCVVSAGGTSVVMEVSFTGNEQ